MQPKFLLRIWHRVLLVILLASLALYFTCNYIMPFIDGCPIWMLIPCAVVTIIGILEYVFSFVRRLLGIKVPWD
jgi:hypothetical protein